MEDSRTFSGRPGRSLRLSTKNSRHDGCNVEDLFQHTPFVAGNASSRDVEGTPFSKIWQDE